MNWGVIFASEACNVLYLPVVIDSLVDLVHRGIWVVCLWYNRRRIMEESRGEDDGVVFEHRGCCMGFISGPRGFVLSCVHT